MSLHGCKARTVVVCGFPGANCLLPDQNTGIHVHTSPGDPNRPWQLREVQNISCAALWFERAFEVILPESRRKNEWSASIKADNRLLKDCTLPQCFQWIRMCQNMKQLIWLMNPAYLWEGPPTARFTFPPHDELQNIRFWGWNFANLGEAETCKGTIGISWNGHSNACYRLPKLRKLTMTLSRISSSSQHHRCQRLQCVGFLSGPFRPARKKPHF